MILKILSFLLIVLVISGCSNESKKMDSVQRVVVENKSTEKINVEYEKNIKYLEEKVSELERKDRYDSESRLLFDLMVDEKIATTIIMESIKSSTENTHYNLYKYLYDNLDTQYDKTCDKLNVICSENNLNSDIKMRMSLNFIENIKNNLSDTRKVNFYYKKIKEPLLSVIIDKYKSGDFSYLMKIVEIRDKISTLKNEGRLKFINENFNNGNYDFTIEYFVYNQYVKHNNDIEIINLYVTLLDDFIAIAKDRLRQFKPETTFQAVIPGLYTPQNMPIKWPYDWYGLFKIGPDYFLKNVDVTIFISKDINLDNDYIVSTSGENEPILLLNGTDWLVEGKVYTSIADADVNSGGLFAHHITMPVTGEIYSLEITKSNVVSNGFSYTGHSLILSGKGKQQQVVPTFDANTSFSIVWIGDVDRDNNPDVLTRLSPEGKGYSYYLYLSKGAKNGNLLDNVVCSSPDGGGC